MLLIVMIDSGVVISFRLVSYQDIRHIFLNTCFDSIPQNGSSKPIECTGIWGSHTLIPGSVRPSCC